MDVFLVKLQNENNNENTLRDTVCNINSENVHTDINLNTWNIFLNYLIDVSS